MRGWCQEQTYPRHLFEVVLVAPEGFPAAELNGLSSLLTPRDRLLLRPERHDMALCAQGAKAASQEVLFFTEAHCRPEPDVLVRSAEALASHPEWAGFSCRSVPVTSNRLSVVEADMYEADIEYGMTKHPWRKILDQCFVVRRGPYFEAAGFDAAFGHFAEWLLAARFFQLGFAVGYCPAARIHHHYVGRVRIWREFMEDFVSGQISFLSRWSADPIARLFEPVPEWEQRANWHPLAARRMLKVLLREMSRPRKGNGRAALAAQIPRWLPAAASGTGIEILAFSLRASLIRVLLVGATRFTPGAKLRRVMMAYCGALTRVRRLRFLAELRKQADPEAGESSDSAAWEPGTTPEPPLVGFHPPEPRGEPPYQPEEFRWSEPAAMVALPLGPGLHEIAVEWMPVGPGDGPREPRFYFNEYPLPPESCERRPDGALLRARVRDGETGRLAWVCPGVKAPPRRRALGLQVRRLSWRRCEP